MTLTHVSLFTGIGGIDLAAEWAGFETICFVEIDKYCQKVLKKHWPDVPIIGDIKDVTKERIQEIITHSHSRGLEGASAEGQGINDVIGDSGEAGKERIMAYAAQQSRQTHKVCSGGPPTTICSGESNRSGATISPITLVTGGFPCQPVSTAGKRKGKEDDRWLWPEMLRVISEVRPTWVVAENVAGLIRMGFNDCVSDLESKGYETISFLIPACAVNAPHRRDRVFIVGYAKPDGFEDRHQETRREFGQGEQEGTGDVGNSTELHQHGGNDKREEGDAQVPRLGDTGGKDYVTDSGADRLQRAIQAGNSVSQAETFIKRGKTTRGNSEGRTQWAVEPDVGRVAHGIPSRVDRLKCLGNAVVPQQIYPILKAIADIATGQAIP